MTATSDQVVIQRYLCTRDARQARRSFLYCLVGDLAIILALCAVGIALIGFFMAFPGEMPDTSQSMIAQADKLFPHYIATLLPPGITGLVTAALFAAAMSSMDSGINSITTVLLTDFKKVFVGRCGDDNRRLMKRARIIGMVIGGLVIAVSNVAQYTHGQNLFDKSMRISGYFIVPLFVIFAMAFFVRFSTPAGGYVAIAVGFLAGVLFSFWKPLLGYFGIEYPEFSVFLIAPVATFCSLCAGILVSALTKPRAPTRT
jgi:SSS family solute:Na+ symporter